MFPCICFLPNWLDIMLHNTHIMLPLEIIGFMIHLLTHDTLVSTHQASWFTPQNIQLTKGETSLYFHFAIFVLIWHISRDNYCDS